MRVKKQLHNKLSQLVCHRTLVLANALICSLLFCKQALADDCYHNTYTQSELNACSNDLIQLEKNRLAETLTALNEKYRGDEVFVKALMRSQYLWEQSLEADTYLKFPNRDPNAYGSSFPLCYNDYQRELYRQRITFLNQWLDGPIEGDLCTGSVQP